MRATPEKMESNELIIEGEFVSKDTMLNQWGWNQPRGACQPPSSCRQVPAKDLVLCRNSKVNNDALPFFPCFLGSRKNPLASDQGGRSFPNQSPRFTRMTMRLVVEYSPPPQHFSADPPRHSSQNLRSNVTMRLFRTKRTQEQN